MTTWPAYKSIKYVRAMPITAITPDKTILVGPLRTPFYPTVPSMVSQAQVGGYAVIYADGYQSISPAKAFEDGYILVSEEEAERATRRPEA